MMSISSRRPIDTGPWLRAAAGCRVTGEVLQRRDHPGALQATDVGGAEHRDQVRVLADGLLDAPPAVVTHDVQDGRKSLMYAHRGHVAPDRGGHPLDQVGVERGAPGDRGRVHRGAVRREAGEALLMDQGGDAQPGVLQDDPVLPHQVRRAVHSGQRLAAVHPGEVAEPVPARLGERNGAGGGEDVLHRRDVDRGLRVGRRSLGVVLHVVEDPSAAELANLLLQGHLREKEIDPVRDGQRRVLPRPRRPVGGGLRVGGRHVSSSFAQVLVHLSKLSPHSGDPNATVP